MGLFRVSRDTQRDDRYLRLRMIIFAIGGALGLAGMTSRRDWLVASGIAVLSVVLVLRILSARQRDQQSDSEDEQPH